LAVVLLSETMLNHFRLGLRRIFPSVRVDTETLEYVLRNEVLKRELVEGEEADAAAALVKKGLRAAAREKRRAAKAGVSAPAHAAPPIPHAVVLAAQKP
jgi:hypothetical protein